MEVHPNIFGEHLHIVVDVGLEQLRKFRFEVGEEVIDLLKLGVVVRSIHVEGVRDLEERLQGLSLFLFWGHLLK